MKLINILTSTDYQLLQGTIDQEIGEIQTDSRKVRKNDLFICLKGAQSDGHNFIETVVLQGASVIIVEDPAKIPDDCKNTTIIQAKNTRKILAQIAANRFDHPLKHLKVIGITGTKGKTTTATMIRDILANAGYQVGLIGTMGVTFSGITYETINTTPDALTLQRFFKEMVKSSCSHVIMEVSSQGFKQFRTAGIQFDYGLFLNIDPDHIGANEHTDFSDYFNCKRQIFSQSRQMIINKNNSLWKKLSAKEKNHAITFSSTNKADYYIDNYALLNETSCLGSTFNLQGQYQKLMKLRIPGLFNIENALAAIALADQLGINKETVTKTLESFEINGRTQLLKEALPFGRTVLLDYAHNSLSMTSLLKTLKSYQPRQLFCVFGLRENKPQMRRYDIGLAAGKYADRIVLTEDNPGTQKFETIISDTLRAISYNSRKPVKIIPNRKDAICYALDQATKNDIIVISGKGHECYQDFNGRRVYFSEEEIVLNHLRSKQSRQAKPVHPAYLKKHQSTSTYRRFV